MLRLIQAGLRQAQLSGLKVFPSGDEGTQPFDYGMTMLHPSQR
jgi:hypothetical protein